MRFYQTQCESFEGVTILPNLPTFGRDSWIGPAQWRFYSIRSVKLCLAHLGLTQKQLHILYADASRLAALRKLGISRYSSVFAPCHPGASTPKIAN